MDDIDLSNASTEILAYFSHSYHPEDRDLNLFFWHLFCDHGFLLTVDPKSEFISIPYLEDMMQRSSCFVAVVTFRREVERTRCSPYIVFEYGLATQAKKPKLVFLEDGVSARFFQGKANEVVGFNRATLGLKTNSFRHPIRKMSEKVCSYGDPATRLHKKVGIIIDTERGMQRVYSESVIDTLAEAVDRFGYDLVEIRPDFSHSSEFCFAIDDCNFLILEQRSSLISPWIPSYVFGRFTPCIRTCYYTKGLAIDLMELSPLISKHSLERENGRLESMVYWNSTDELVNELSRHMTKLEQPRVLLNTRELGDGYFQSTGRSPEKVFVSNTDTQNGLAMELARNFRTLNINFFHYKEENAIPVGERWMKELEKQLEESRILIAIIDKDYLNRRWCRYELDFALKHSEMKVFAYCLEGSIPDELEEIQVKELAGMTSKEIVKIITHDIDSFLVKEAGSASPIRDTIMI